MSAKNKSAKRSTVVASEISANSQISPTLTPEQSSQFLPADLPSTSSPDGSLSPELSSQTHADESKSTNEKNPELSTTTDESKTIVESKISGSSSEAITEPSIESILKESISGVSSSNEPISISHQDVLMIEAILFAAGTRITVSRIMELAKISDRARVEVILSQLAQKHTAEHSAFDLMNMGEDWKMTVKKQFLSVAEKIAPDAELPKSIIETLAILAWKAPMTQSDLVKIRSNKAYDHIEGLQQRGFINRERRGRTYVLKLTPKFYEYFDVQGKKQITKLFERFGKREDAVDLRQATKVEQEQLLLAQKAAKSKETLATLGQEPAEDVVTVKKIKDAHKNKQQSFFDDIDSRLSGIVSRTSAVKDDIAKIATSDTVAALQTAVENKTNESVTESETPNSDAKSDADDVATRAEGGDAKSANDDADEDAPDKVDDGKLDETKD